MRRTISRTIGRTVSRTTSRTVNRSALAHLLLLGVVVVWGGMFVLIKRALGDATGRGEISPLLFNLLRMVTASIALAIFYRRPLRRLDGPALRSGALVGVCLAAGYQFQTAGLRLTTASRSAFLTGLVVVLVPLLSMVPGLRASGTRRPAAVAGMGAAVAFAGLLLLTMPQGAPLTFATLLSGFGKGELLTLGCAFAFAFHMLALAHAAPRLPYQQLAVVQITFAALMMAVTLPVFEPHPFLHPGIGVLVAMALAGLLATAAAFTIQSWAQQFLPATHTVVILTLEPVFALVASFLFLHERLSARAATGAGLILAGIALTELPARSMQPVAHEGAPVL
jgi:drug/metabolite transporter (DMT)-like permease